MQGVLPAPPAVLVELDPIAIVHTVLDRVVVPPPAVRAGERDLGAVPLFLGHGVCSLLVLGYFRILVTRPAPTVRPPSRIANRRPSSIAIGLISSTVISTLSPGITISTPPGRLAVPVTSVVRK